MRGAGDLRHRLVLQHRIRTPDGAGGFSESWANVSGDAVVHAAVHAVGGSEGVAGGQVQGRVTCRIVIRYRENIGPDMRLSDGVRDYDIIAVLDRDGRRQYLEVTAQYNA